jgi:hypothetical protein
MVPLPPSLADDPLILRAEQVMAEARVIVAELHQILRLRRNGKSPAERTRLPKEPDSPNLF